MATRFDPPFLIGIDVGTGSVRAIAFDARGRRAAQAMRPTPARMQAGGRGEYDPDKLFAAVTRSAASARAAFWSTTAAGRWRRRWSGSTGAPRRRRGSWPRPSARTGSSRSPASPSTRP
jgi:hypothetical protein